MTDTEMTAAQRYPLQTALRASPLLFTLAFTAPHCAIRPSKKADSYVLHAVTMEAIIDAYDGRKTFTAACGADKVKILSVEMKGEGALPWPPRIAGLAPMSRCRDCWIATGKKRPRSGRVGATQPGRPS